MSLATTPRSLFLASAVCASKGVSETTERTRPQPGLLLCFKHPLLSTDKHLSTRHQTCGNCVTPNCHISQHDIRHGWHPRHTDYAMSLKRNVHPLAHGVWEALRQRLDDRRQPG